MHASETFEDFDFIVFGSYYMSCADGLDMEVDLNHVKDTKPLNKKVLRVLQSWQKNN